MLLDLKQFDRVTLDEGDISPLDIWTLAVGRHPPVALSLAITIKSVHFEHGDIENRLNRIADLGLRRLLGNLEGVNVVFMQSV